MDMDMEQGITAAVSAIITAEVMLHIHIHENGVCPYAGSVSRSTIRKVQNTLNSCGYSCGTADGVMGTKTKKALKKYQRDNGLKADGVIGSATLKCMGL